MFETNPLFMGRDNVPSSVRGIAGLFEIDRVREKIMSRDRRASFRSFDGIVRAGVVTDTVQY